MINMLNKVNNTSGLIKQEKPKQTASPKYGMGRNYVNSGRNALIGSAAGVFIPMLITKKAQKVNILSINYEFREMIFVGTGAIMGGVLGGMFDNRRNSLNRKLKEANFQWIANLFLPTLFVDRLLKLSEKHFKDNSRKVAKAASVIVGVGAGMKLGETLANKMHFLFFDCNKRNIKPVDVILHADDLPMALTLSKVPYADKLLPFCFIYSGYQAGKK